MIGYVSQLCHAIAVSLMCANDNSSLCEYTGDSFRDLTRIARINEKMWAELFLWNKENLIAEIDQFDSALDQLRDASWPTTGTSWKRCSVCPPSAAPHSTKRTRDCKGGRPCPSRRDKNPNCWRCCISLSSRPTRSIC